MKKHLRLLLCAVLVLCMLQLPALAAQPNPLEIVCSDVGQTTREITVSVFATEEITDGVCATLSPYCSRRRRLLRWSRDRPECRTGKYRFSVPDPV